MLLSQSNLDYKKHFQVSFGAYVQANNDDIPTNTMASRTRDGIYLRARPGNVRGHEVMDLNSGMLITCRKVTEIPMTDTVIKAVETMAYAQGFVDLKFYNRRGEIFHDADWSEGVDYAADTESDDGGNDNDDDQNNDQGNHANDNDELDDLPELKRDEYDSDSDSSDDESDYGDEEEYIEDTNRSVEPKEHHVTVEDVEEGDELDGESNAEAEQPEDEIPASPERNKEGTRRSSRTTRTTERLSPKMKGTSYTNAQQRTNKHHGRKTKSFAFLQQERKRLEQCHNLTTQQVESDPENCFEYDPDDAALLAIYIEEFNQRMSILGVTRCLQR
jgi:hypothetical protein